MKERWILHADIDHCYAQIHEMLYPDLRKVPMAVGGHEEMRHGIILAKNDLAKQYGIKTAESLREAYEKLPSLLIIHPLYPLYITYTEKVKDIYREYTDRVESFGLDEAWADLTPSLTLFGASATDLAKHIQNRVYKEMGLTVSLGLSFNKVFAKLGSDQRKPHGFYRMTKQDYPETVWPLPVEDLLFVGRATKEKLRYYGITTIGQLARRERSYLKKLFGKNGETLWFFANGMDVTEVASGPRREVIKSVGNGITTPADINTFDEAREVFLVLCESVATRLRENGLAGQVVSVMLRGSDLAYIGRQRKLSRPTDLATEILEMVMILTRENWRQESPLRSIGVTISSLKPALSYRQSDLFTDERAREKEVRLEQVIDRIRSKYGYDAIKRLGLLECPHLTNFNPLAEHVIHPESWY